MMDKLPIEIIRYISLYFIDVIIERNGVYISRIMKSDERYKIFDTIRYHVCLNNWEIYVCNKNPHEILNEFNSDYFTKLSKIKLNFDNMIMMHHNFDIIKVLQTLEKFMYQS